MIWYGSHNNIHSVLAISLRVLEANVSHVWRSFIGPRFHLHVSNLQFNVTDALKTVSDRAYRVFECEFVLQDVTVVQQFNLRHIYVPLTQGIFF